MKNIVIITNNSKSLWRFRGPLIFELIQRGHIAVCYVPVEECEELNNVKLLGAFIKDLKVDRTGMNPIKDIIYYGSSDILMGTGVKV